MTGLKFNRSSALLLSAMLFNGCVPKSLPVEMGREDFGVEIIWHGHACFTLRDSFERTVVIDPFDKSVGYGRLRLLADALLISDPHFDHNYQRGVKARLRILDIMVSTGTTSVARGMWVTAIASYRDNEKGEIHGDNRIFAFTMGGLRIVHLGGLGQRELTPFQVGQAGPVDILFVPVGGFTTMDAKSARRVVDQLAPSAIFPMNYGDIRMFKFAPVSEFTRLFDKSQIISIEGSEIRLTRADLHQPPLVYLLEPAKTAD